MFLQLLIMLLLFFPFFLLLLPKLKDVLNPPGCACCWEKTTTQIGSASNVSLNSTTRLLPTAPHANWSKPWFCIFLSPLLTLQSIQVGHVRRQRLFIWGIAWVSVRPRGPCSLTFAYIKSLVQRTYSMHGKKKNGDRERREKTKLMQSLVMTVSSRRKLPPASWTAAANHMCSCIDGDAKSDVN